MAYATTDELTGYLGKAGESLYRSAPGAAAADLADASAEIDGYLAKRYRVPVTDEQCQILLRKWCLALAGAAAYRLGGGSEIPKKFQSSADETRRMLRDTANGVFSLPASPAEAENSVGGAVAVECDEPLCTRETMRGY